MFDRTTSPQSRQGVANGREVEFRSFWCYTCNEMAAVPVEGV